ncbi:hypothetical protein B0H16DRAFT_1901243 [Mycena metata]|uniref:PB1 domain-containing protein n=1 Tax=Mycena metata TaxID=1033252 RepID=A0AAD7MAT6_9AGAR|nr:hypothetical protein B0H16DRAFT_1901243 [Mycena metata]
MSLKVELETWAAALKAYDEEEFEKALDLFSRIDDSSKILTNIGLIYAILGEHEAAVEKFIEATGLDTYLAVAYFQCGVSNFLLQRYEPAYKDFEEALLYLRGNQAINYEQLGLKFTLFSAEVLFNLGLCLISLGRLGEGLANMEEAKRVKATDEHNVIDDAIQDREEGYAVFSIPKGVLYRPSEKKHLNPNARTRGPSCMGNVRFIAATDSRDTTVGSSGNDRLQQEEGHASGEHFDPPHELIKIRVKTKILVSATRNYMGKVQLIAASGSRDTTVGSSGNDRLQQGITPTVTSGGEEEGHASGEHSDRPHKLIKIRVKLHYDDDLRGMALTPETPFEEFMDRVTAKFDKEINGLTFEFKDPDGRKMSLRDESDWEIAIETAREGAKGKPEGRLQIWCTDA